MDANTENLETLRQRIYVLACQKISLESQVAELKADILALKIDRDALANVLREALTLIFENDPAQVTACEREPAGNYETLAADLYQLISAALKHD